MKKGFKIIGMLGVLILFTANAFVFAAEFPSKAITVIVPRPPGGSRDVIARTFASVGEKLLGQPIVVINKAGAGGFAGGLAGAQAPPDGYTLTLTSSADTCAIEWEIASGRKPPFTLNDFVTIGSFTLSPPLVVVPYNSPWKTLADLIKDCKAKPNHYAYAVGGMYGSVHMSTEIFMNAAGIKARNVPFKGGGPALTAIVGGHVDFSLQMPSTAINLARGNKLRILAGMGDSRIDSIPDVPTMKELGVNAKNYQMLGLLAPKKTPRPVVEKLKGILAKTVKDKSFIDAVEKTGEDPYYMDGDELSKYLEQESKLIAKIMTELPKEEEPKK